MNHNNAVLPVHGEMAPDNLLLGAAAPVQAEAGSLTRAALSALGNFSAIMRDSYSVTMRSLGFSNVAVTIPLGFTSCLALFSGAFSFLHHLREREKSIQTEDSWGKFFAELACGRSACITFLGALFVPGRAIALAEALSGSAVLTQIAQGIGALVTGLAWLFLVR